MEDQKELLELLENMKKSNEQQALFAKLQGIFSAVSAVCCIIVLVVVLSILPHLKNMMTQVDVVLTNVEDVSQQLVDADVAGVMGNLQHVTAQLAEADLDAMVKDVGRLVDTSQNGLEDALGKLNAIDFETLNQAIEDLAAVVEPMSEFFSMFG